MQTAKAAKCRLTMPSFLPHANHPCSPKTGLEAKIVTSLKFCEKPPPVSLEPAGQSASTEALPPAGRSTPLLTVMKLSLGDAGRARRTLGTLESLVALGSRESLVALGTLESLRSGRALGPLGTGRSLGVPADELLARGALHLGVVDDLDGDRSTCSGRRSRCRCRG